MKLGSLLAALAWIAAAVLTLIWASPVFAAAASPPARLPSSYVELYRQVVARQAANKRPSLFENLITGEAAIRLARRTREPAYLATAERRFAAAWADGQPDLRDFHSLMAFSRLTLLLKEEGRIPPDFARPVREIAARQLRAFIQSTDNGDYNIRIAQVLAYASLLKYLEGGEYADREAARKRLDDYWLLIRQIGDLDEDSANYDSLGMVLLVDLARLTGRTDDLKRSAGFRRVFERFRDIVSPSGLIPEYGDAYFSTTSCLLDRVYLMEFAAGLYGDPSFLFAARKLYRRPAVEFPKGDLWFRGLGLIDLDLSPAQPREPQAVSLVTSRNRRGESQPLTDKLILRTGLGPGDAMICMDLYASGSHAHMEKGPSIAYYEADGVPLFHNMGRHGTESAITGNILWCLPGKERFPGCWNRADEWFTMSIPSEYLQRDGQRYVVAPTMLLRNFQELSRSCRALSFDNLRLEGPAGTRLVDGFEDPARWDAKLRKLTEVSLARGGTQGEFYERVPWKPLPSTHLARKLAAPPEHSFGSDEYQSLKLDLKYEGGRPMMHIRGLGRQVDLGDQLLVSRLAGATAEQRGHDACGRVTYSSYITPDTRLTRRIVLTAEGCLVVHDILVPAPSMKGWDAGQLWQLYEKAAGGRDWFLSDDDGEYPALAGATKVRRMLVRFAMDSRVTIGCEEVRQGYYGPNPKGRKAERFFTTYSRAAVTPGRKEHFAMVIVPLPAGPADGGLLAERESICVDADGRAVAVVRLGDGRRLQVRLGETAWEVVRDRGS